MTSEVINNVTYATLSSTITTRDLYNLHSKGLDVYSLKNEYSSIGISTNLAIYAIDNDLFDYMKLTSLVPFTDTISKTTLTLLITKFCECKFNDGSVFYSFGNIFGKGVIIIKEEQVTQELRKLISLPLQNVVLNIDNGGIDLISYELRSV